MATRDDIYEDDGFDSVFSAIAEQESSGNYRAVGAPTPYGRALGKYQIIPPKIAEWGKKHLGRVPSKSEFLNTPEIQETIARGAMRDYYRNALARTGGDRHTATKMTASAWYSGDPDNYRSTKPQKGGFPSIAEYANSVARRAQRGGGGSSSTWTPPQPIRVRREEVEPEPKKPAGVPGSTWDPGALPTGSALAEKTPKRDLDIRLERRPSTGRSSGFKGSHGWQSERGSEPSIGEKALSAFRAGPGKKRDMVGEYTRMGRALLGQNNLDPREYRERQGEARAPGGGRSGGGSMDPREYRERELARSGDRYDYIERERRTAREKRLANVDANAQANVKPGISTRSVFRKPSNFAEDNETTAAAKLGQISLERRDNLRTTRVQSRDETGYVPNRSTPTRYEPARGAERQGGRGSQGFLTEGANEGYFSPFAPKDQQERPRFAIASDQERIALGRMKAPEGYFAGQDRRANPYQSLDRASRGYVPPPEVPLDPETRARAFGGEELRFQQSPLGRMQRAAARHVFPLAAGAELFQDGLSIGGYQVVDGLRQRYNRPEFQQSLDKLGAAENPVRGVFAAGEQAMGGLSMQYLQPDASLPPVAANPNKPYNWAVDIGAHAGRAAFEAPLQVATMMAGGGLLGRVAPGLVGEGATGLRGLAGRSLTGSTTLGGYELASDQPGGMPYRETLGERGQRGLEAAATAALFPLVDVPVSRLARPFVRRAEGLIARRALALEGLAIPGRAESALTMATTSAGMNAVLGRKQDVGQIVEGAINAAVFGPELNRFRADRQVPVGLARGETVSFARGDRDPETGRFVPDGRLQTAVVVRDKASGLTLVDNYGRKREFSVEEMAERQLRGPDHPQTQAALEAKAREGIAGAEAPSAPAPTKRLQRKVRQQQARAASVEAGLREAPEPTTVPKPRRTLTRESKEAWLARRRGEVPAEEAPAPKTEDVAPAPTTADRVKTLRARAEERKKAAKGFEVVETEATPAKAPAEKSTAPEKTPVHPRTNEYVEAFSKGKTTPEDGSTFVGKTAKRAYDAGVRDPEAIGQILHIAQQAADGRIDAAEMTTRVRDIVSNARPAARKPQTTAPAPAAKPTAPFVPKPTAPRAEPSKGGPRPVFEPPIVAPTPAKAPGPTRKAIAAPDTPEWTAKRDSIRAKLEAKKLAPEDVDRSLAVADELAGAGANVDAEGGVRLWKHPTENKYSTRADSPSFGGEKGIASKLPVNRLRMIDAKEGEATVEFVRPGTQPGAEGQTQPDTSVTSKPDSSEAEAVSADDSTPPIYTKEQVDAYRPSRAVRQGEKGWTYQTIDGKPSGESFRTKKQAGQAAAKHKTEAQAALKAKPAAKPTTPVSEKRGPDRISDEEWNAMSDEEKNAHRKALEDAVDTDALTGIGNRRAYNRRVEEMEAEGGEIHTTLVDGNGMGGLNDTAGYALGDAVIKATAEALRGQGLTVYRYGGDEFVILHRGDEGVQEAVERADADLRSRVVEAIHKDGTELTVTNLSFSFGTGKGKTGDKAWGKANVELSKHKKRLEAEGVDRAAKGTVPPGVRIGVSGDAEPGRDSAGVGEGETTPEVTRSVDDIQRDLDDAEKRYYEAQDAYETARSGALVAGGGRNFKPTEEVHLATRRMKEIETEIRELEVELEHATDAEQAAPLKSYDDYQREIDALETKLEKQGIDVIKTPLAKLPKELRDLYDARDAVGKQNDEAGVAEIGNRLKSVVPDAAKRTKLARIIGQADVMPALRAKQSWRDAGEVANQVLQFVREDMDDPGAFTVDAVLGGPADSIGTQLRLTSERGLGPRPETLQRAQEILDALYGDEAPKLPGAKAETSKSLPAKPVKSKEREISDIESDLLRLRSKIAKTVKGTPEYKALVAEYRALEKRRNELTGPIPVSPAPQDSDPVHDARQRKIMAEQRIAQLEGGLETARENLAKRRKGSKPYNDALERIQRYESDLASARKQLEGENAIILRAELDPKIAAADGLYERGKLQIQHPDDNIRQLGYESLRLVAATEARNHHGVGDDFPGRDALFNEAIHLLDAPHLRPKQEGDRPFQREIEAALALRNAEADTQKAHQTAEEVRKAEAKRKEAEEKQRAKEEAELRKDLSPVPAEHAEALSKMSAREYEAYSERLYREGDYFNGDVTPTMKKNGVENGWIDSANRVTAKGAEFAKSAFRDANTKAQGKPIAERTADPKVKALGLLPAGGQVDGAKWHTNGHGAWKGEAPKGSTYTAETRYTDPERPANVGATIKGLPKNTVEVKPVAVQTHPDIDRLTDPPKVGPPRRLIQDQIVFNNGVVLDGRLYDYTLKAFGDDVVWRAHPTDNTKPVTAHKGDEIVAVIMPMRADLGEVSRSLVDTPAAKQGKATGQASPIRMLFPDTGPSPSQTPPATRESLLKAATEIYGADGAAELVGVVAQRAAAWSRINNLPASEYYARRIAELTSVEGGEAKANITFLKDGRAIIRAFQNSTVSDAIHEVFHMFRRDLAGSALRIAERWAGVEGGKWTVDAEEKFVRAFERYRKDQTAPDTGMRRVFTDFATWLKDVYSSVRGLPTTKDMKNVFDSLLDADAAISMRDRIAIREAELLDRIAVRDGQMSPRAEGPTTLFKLPPYTGPRGGTAGRRGVAESLRAGADESFARVAVRQTMATRASRRFGKKQQAGETTIIADLADLIDLAEITIRNGAADFADWSAKYSAKLTGSLGDDYTERVQPYLKDIYEQARNRGVAEQRQAERRQRQAQTQGTGRIDIDPLNDGKPARKPVDIIGDLARGVNRRVRVSKSKGPRVLGMYYPGSGRTNLRYAQDLDTGAHEFVHVIDDAYGIVAEWAYDTEPSPYDDELIPHFSQHGSEPPSNIDDARALTYTRAEGVAEFGRAWAVNPAAARAAAPEFAKYWESHVPEPVLAVFRKFGDDYRRHVAATNSEKVVLGTRMQMKTETMLDKLLGPMGKRGDVFRTRFLDRMHPVWKSLETLEKEFGRVLTPDTDPHYLYSAFLGVDTKLETIFEHGMVDTEGNFVTKGVMDEIYGPLDKTSMDTIKADMDHVVSLGLSELVVERHARELDQRMQAIDSAKQAAVDRLDSDHDRLREENQVDKLRIAQRYDDALELYKERIETQYQYRSGLRTGKSEGAAGVKAKRAMSEGRLKAANNIIAAAERRLIKAEGREYTRQTRDVQNIEDLINERKRRAFENLDARLERRIQREQTALDERFERARVRSAERLDIRYSRVTGVAAGSKPGDLNVHRGVIKDFDNLPPEQQARVRASLDGLRRWSRATLEYAAAKGIISPEAFSAMSSMSDYYIAMQRVMDEAEALGTVNKPARSSRNIAAASKVYHRWNGSTREIENPIVATLQQTANIIREADRNEFVRTFADALIAPREMYMGKVNPYDLIGSKGAAGDKNVTKVIRNGKVEYWNFDEDILRALRGLNDLTTWPKIATYPGQLLRMGVTYAPPFIVRNMIRDTVNRSIISEHGGKPWDILPVIGQGYTKEELIEARIAGLGQFGHYAQGREAWHKFLSDQMHHISKDRNFLLMSAKDIGRFLKRGSEKSEMIGRMAEYKRAKKAALARGMTESEARMYAVKHSRELLDFAVAGDWVHQVNQIIPFTNAAVQGLRRTARTAKEHPGAFMAKSLAYAILPTIGNLLFNAGQGEETLEEYLSLPAYQRDMFWNFKLPEGSPWRWVSIPKPFEVGVLATGLERMIASGYFEDKHAYDGWLESAAKALVPVDVDAALAIPLVRPTLETRYNYDSFRAENVIPTWEQTKDVDLREGTPRATRVGRTVQAATGLFMKGASQVPLLGDVMEAAGLFPINGDSLEAARFDLVDGRKIDHWLAGTFGTSGRLALQASDVIIPREDKPEAGSKFAGTMLGLIKDAPGYNARDVKYVLERAEGRGEERAPDVRDLRDILTKASNAETNEERYDLLRRARQKADRMRDKFDRTGSFK